MKDRSKLYQTAAALLAPDKGILAADQSTGTINKQLARIGVTEDAEMRRLYRQLLFTTEGIEQYVSGIIMYDSSIRNQTDDGTPFVDLITSKGIIPIIKVDKGPVPFTGFEGEVVTEGLDGLKERFKEYYDMGARAAKWRAIVNIGENIPSDQSIHFNSVLLARFSSLAQEAGIVPIVEPDVIFKGNHDIVRAEEVTTNTLAEVFSVFAYFNVDLKGVILKTSMVLSGSENPSKSSPEEVAEATLRALNESVPEEVPGVVFLSGGQTPERATANLDAIGEKGPQKWELAFSFSRGIQQPVLEVWKGKSENVKAAQEALLKRLKLNSLVSEGDENGVGKGHVYYTRKNKRKLADRTFEFKKFNPVAKKHTIYKEKK